MIHFCVDAFLNHWYLIQIFQVIFVYPNSWYPSLLGQLYWWSNGVADFVFGSPDANWELTIFLESSEEANHVDYGVK